MIRRNIWAYNSFMEHLFFIVALSGFGYGAFLLTGFVRWRLQSRKAIGEIIGFKTRTMYGAYLPVIRFETQEGEKIEAAAVRIDRLLYLLNRPSEGALVTISYDIDTPHIVRVSGYIDALIAAVLMVPLIAAVGVLTGQAILASKAAFLLVFIGIILGGWIALKLIQKT